MTQPQVCVVDRVGHRAVSFGDGRTLTVRPTTGDDVDDLAKLYEQLSLDDRRFRFFSLYHPPCSFYERQAHLEECGGCGLVAVVSDRVVGDAGYVPLPDGGAEFALTVAPDWRGWLGPYLLDALVEVAAARGLPNLQADVLADNHRMLALLQRRGYVRVANGDYSVIRAAIATTGSMPFWAWRKEAPLVVAEVPGGRWRGETDAGRAGWRVVGCSRAGATGRLGCPALADRPCPLAMCADVVVVGYPTSAQGGALIAAHELLHPGVPVSVAAGDRREQVQAVITTLQSTRRHHERGGKRGTRSGASKPGSSPDRSRAPDRRP